MSAPPAGNFEERLEVEEGSNPDFITNVGVGSDSVYPEHPGLAP
jgi:hypothetical protein